MKPALVVSFLLGISCAACVSTSGDGTDTTPQDTRDEAQLDSVVDARDVDSPDASPDDTADITDTTDTTPPDSQDVPRDSSADLLDAHDSAGDTECGCDDGTEDRRDCDAPHATQASQVRTCTGECWGSWSTCTASACDSGYHLCDGACQLEPCEPARFDVHYEWDFESETLGSWNHEEITAYFTTHAEGLTSIENFNDNAWIVEDTINGSTTNVLRMEHTTLEWWHGLAIKINIQPGEEYYVEYDFKFGENWNNTSNGKISGLRTRTGVSNPREASDGWMNNINFNGGLTLDSYHYDDTYSWVPWSQGQQHEELERPMLVPGTWYKLGMRLRVPTYTNGASNSDAINEIFVNGDISIQESGFNLHRDEAFDINCFYIANFHGGGGDQDPPAPVETYPDLPTRESYGYIDNIVVYTPLDDPVAGTQSLHDPDFAVPMVRPLTDRNFHYKVLLDDDSVNLENSSYPDANDYFTNDLWLLEAPVGHTITVTFSGGETSSGDVLAFYDGRDTDATKLASQLGYDDDLSDNFGASNGVVSSTGRYLFVEYMTDYRDGGRFSADIAFSP